MAGQAHVSTPPDGWHGSRFTGGLDASKGLPTIAGQIYRATDTGIVYIGNDDLLGWSTLLYEGVGFTPGFLGVQTWRTPALSVLNNTNTSINHSSDTVVYDQAGFGMPTTLFTIPTGMGGLWIIHANGKWTSGGSGAIYMDIENSVGSSAGGGDWDGSFGNIPTPFQLEAHLLLDEGDTFNLRAYQNAGSTQTLHHYRIKAYLAGVPE